MENFNKVLSRVIRVVPFLLTAGVAMVLLFELGVFSNKNNVPDDEKQVVEAIIDDSSVPKSDVPENNKDVAGNEPASVEVADAGSDSETENINTDITVDVVEVVKVTTPKTTETKTPNTIVEIPSEETPLSGGSSLPGNGNSSGNSGNNNTASEPSKEPETPVTPSEEEKEVVYDGPDFDYTRGQWVLALADKLGMNLGVDAESLDYYYGDTEESIYGAAIEIAQLYDILPAPDVEDIEQDVPLFNPDAPATREFAAYTSIRALGYIDNGISEAGSWADSSSIEYPFEDSVAVDLNMLKLDDSNRFNPDATLKAADGFGIIKGIERVEASEEILPEEIHDNSVYAEGVKEEEFRDLTDYEFTKKEDGTCKVVIGTTDKKESFVPGEVIVLPATDELSVASALKVTSVTEENGTLIVNGETPELYEVFSEIDFAGYGTPIISQIVTAEGVSCEYSPNKIGEGENLHPLNIDSDGSFGVPGTFKFTIAEKKISDKLKVSGGFEVEVPEVRCKVKAHVGLFDTSFDEFLLTCTEKVKIIGELEYTVTEAGYELPSQGDRRFEKGKIEIGRIPIQINPTFSFDLVLFYDFEVKGTASITYTFTVTEGVHYSKNKLKPVFKYADELEVLKLMGSAKGGLGISGVLNALKLMDLVGYQIQFGPAFDASFTPHVLATDTLYCADATFYAYAKSGLDTDTVVGKFLESVCHYTMEFDHLANDADNPFKFKLHVENMNRVDECTFGVSTLKGTVLDNDTKAAYKGAKIEIYQNSVSKNNLVRSASSKADGSFKIDNLTAGHYIVKIKATGYRAYTTSVDLAGLNSTETIEAFLMVSRSNNADGEITGDIKDAYTGYKINSIKYTVRDNWNNTTGAVVLEGTATGGSYSITLPAGNYTITFEKEGYVTNHVNVAVQANNSVRKDVSLNPETVSAGGDSIRVVLSWGDTPRDLDSHLFGYRNGSNIFHVYYSKKTYGSYASLDLDDTDGRGPETTTIYNMASSDYYSYCVHDYTNKDKSSSTGLGYSNAKVEVYSGNVKIATFAVPYGAEGTVWKVFDYDAVTDTIIPVNVMSYSSNSATLNGAGTGVSLMSLDDFGLMGGYSLTGKYEEIVDDFDDEMKEDSEDFLEEGEEVISDEDDESSDEAVIDEEDQSSDFGTDMEEEDEASDESEEDNEDFEEIPSGSEEVIVDENEEIGGDSGGSEEVSDDSDLDNGSESDEDISDAPESDAKVA